MTRFFSELVLSAGDGGTLEPFAEELPDLSSTARRSAAGRGWARRRMRGHARAARRTRSALRTACTASLPRPSLRYQPAKLVVTVVDGDHSTRVRSALVDALEPPRAHRHGTASREIHVPGRPHLNVTVERARLLDAHACTSTFEDFAQGDDARVPARSCSGRCTARRRRARSRRSHIRLRPPFKTVWSVGARRR